MDGKGALSRAAESAEFAARLATCSRPLSTFGTGPRLWLHFRALKRTPLERNHENPRRSYAYLHTTPAKAPQTNWSNFVSRTSYRSGEQGSEFRSGEQRANLVQAN